MSREVNESKKGILLISMKKLYYDKIAQKYVKHIKTLIRSLKQLSNST